MMGLPGRPDLGAPSGKNSSRNASASRKYSEDGEVLLGIIEGAVLYSEVVGERERGETLYSEAVGERRGGEIKPIHTDRRVL